MDINELAAQVEALNQAEAGRQSENRFNGFMDKYGMKMGGNANIGAAVLGEMDRRGIDIASDYAMDAVQQVLDQLRQEATTVLDALKGQQEQVADLADKINTIEESIAAASGEQPDTAVPEVALPPDAPPPDMTQNPALEGGDMPPADMPPADMPPADMPPADAGAEAPLPPEGGDMPPPDAGVVSDENLKNIKPRLAVRRVLSDERMKKPVARDVSGIVARLMRGR